jgi:hypothetical protein
MVLVSVTWSCIAVKKPSVSANKSAFGFIIIIIIIIIITVYVRCFWNSGVVIELVLNIPKTPLWFRTKVEIILKETFMFHFILFDMTQFVDMADCLQTIKSKCSFPATMGISLLALSSAR